MAAALQVSFSHFIILLIFTSSLITRSSTATPPSECRLNFPDQAVPTKSGYIPVNPGRSNSAMFYAYYKAQHPHPGPSSQTPILIWLQGGPACSSMLGNFFEIGPYRVSQCHDGNRNDVFLKPNPGTWNRIFDLLFLDNPIGSGFSVASDPAEIPRDQDAVAKHLYAAITGFLELYPAFRSRQIYITGESYAGKFIPSIGYYIVKQNEQQPASKRVNLKGIAIGNGLTDPVTQVTTPASTAYNVGLINERQRSELEQVQSAAVKLVGMKKWVQAANAATSGVSLMMNMTGLATDYDFTRKRPYEQYLVTRLFRSKDAKRKMGANASIEFNVCSTKVRAMLNGDVMQSVKSKVEELLVKKVGKVLLFSGNLDIRLGVASNEAWIRTMNWDGIENYMKAEKNIWRVKGKGSELSGYVQKYESLTSVVLMEAGHMATADQTVNSQAMIEDWVLDKGLFGNKSE
ncbi:unnamed protein product [Linum trigynum]